MKKLLLLPIIIIFLNSCEPNQSTDDYYIEQDWFGKEFTTWIWHKRRIIKSYDIPADSVSKGTIKRDSIRAVNFIDCVKNGKNCELKKPKVKKYTIEQGFMYGEFNTWIWYNNNIVKSYQTSEEKTNSETIKNDSLKAVRWIERTKKLLKK